MEQYTFIFENTDEGKFRKIMSRLEPEDYVLVEDIIKIPAKSEHHRQHQMQTVMNMDSEVALVFRMGLKDLIIKRTRTEAEEAEKKALEDKNRVVIRVKVDGLNKDTLSSYFE